VNNLGADTGSFHESDAFFVWIAALELLLLGLAMRLLPWRFQSAHYAMLYERLPVLGALLTVSGISLIALQLVPMRNPRVRVASRTIAGCLFGLLALTVAGANNWLEAVTYAFLAIGLLVSAAGGGVWLEAHPHVDLFMLIAALAQGVYGAILLPLPARLLNLPQPLPRGELARSALGMLACAGALALWQVRRHGAGRYLLPLMAALPVIAGAYEFGIRQNLITALIPSSLMAAGIVARPIVPHAWLVPPRKRIINKLIAISTLAIGSALVILVALQLRETESAYRQRATLDLGATATVVARESTAFVVANIRQASLLSRDPEITDFDSGTQLGFIQRVLQGDSGISQVVIVDAGGNGVLSSSGGQPSGNLRAQVPGIDQVFRTGEPNWNVVQSAGLKAPVLTVRSPILAADGSFRGVLVSQMRLSSLTEELGKMPFGGSGRIVIVDSQGQVVAHPDAGLVAARADLSRLPPVAAALRGGAGTVVYLDGDQRWLSVQVPVAELGWTVIVERPEAAVLAPAYHAREDSLLVLAVMLALTTVGAVFLARSLSRPLTDLARAAESLGDGSTQAALPSDREDEVGDLIHAFRRMQERLVTRTRERELAEEERGRLLVREQTARAEVEALLDATASLGVQAEPEEVLKTLVEQAAALLRADTALYAVLRDDRIFIPARWSNGAWHEDGHEPRREGILWSVWESGRPYRIDDARSDLRGNPLIMRQHGLRSQLTVALVAPDGQHLGLVSLNNSRRPEGFSERDERLLLAVCETGAAVLMRAHETAARLDAEHAAARRKQEVEALLTAADRLNAPAADANALLERVLKVTAELLDVQHAAFVTDEGDHALGRYEWSNGACRPSNVRMTLSGSAAGWVIRERRPYRSSAVAAGSAAPDEAALGLKTHVLAVLVSRPDGGVLGILTFSDPSNGRPFSDEDERLAEGIAHHAAVALERATLLEELRRREEHLHHQTVTDPLTELPNRTHFLQRLERALESPAQSGSAVAVLFLDLDGFKTVNDTLGHPAGDELLRAAGRRLVACQRGADTVARFGGDEFAVLLPTISQPSDAFIVAERIIREIGRPFPVNGHDVFVTASIGIAVSASAPRSQPEDLLRESDIALYQAKARGKAQFVLFDASMTAVAAERLEMVTELRRAIDGRELRLHYQPFVDLVTGAVAGTEALLRWKHPRRGFLEPRTFIAAMEETGIIVPAGHWVLREACRQAHDWHERRPDAPPLLMSVNCSAQQLSQTTFVEQVAQTVRDSGLFPGSLELEVAEATIMRRPEEICSTLAQLKLLGVRLAIDNFGAGYAALDYVERLAPDRLKIDQCFVRKLDDGQASAGVVRAVLTLAQALNIEVTAEGVETAEQAAALSVLGCRYGQGYYFSRPMPRRDTTVLLDSARLPLRQGQRHEKAGAQAQGPRNASPA
jgi:diguanylate cyclase (GGDEF)-like protein